MGDGRRSAGDDRPRDKSRGGVGHDVARCGADVTTHASHAEHCAVGDGRGDRHHADFRDLLAMGLSHRHAGDWNSIRHVGVAAAERSDARGAEVGCDAREAARMIARRVGSVADLPRAVEGPAAITWWAMAGMMLTEFATLALVAFSYIYI